MKNKTIIRETVIPTKLHIREQHGKQNRIIEGYAIVFNRRSVLLWTEGNSQVYEMISPGAINRQLLDSSDIKLTMFNDRTLILGRSKNGAGTLSYSVDEFGVKFSCEMPKTIDGNKALELVKRGDIVGCSFSFSTNYDSADCVSVSRTKEGNNEIIMCTVKRITGIYDFSLSPDPIYESTSVKAREFAMVLNERLTNVYREQVAEMRFNAL